MLKHKIMTGWIVARSIWTTLKYSTITLFYGYFGQPQDVDKAIQKWALCLLDIVKISYKICDPHHVSLESRRPYIIMSNHESLYDIPLIFMAFPASIRMIAKKELFKVPVWGSAMRRAGFLSIDRKNSSRAMQDLEIVREKMKNGIVPWVAPEGTRSRDGKLGPFKKGGFMLALQTGATIVPVGIRGSRNVLAPKTLDFHLNEKVEIHIGQPIDSSRYTVATRQGLINEVKESIIRLLSDKPTPSSLPKVENTNRV